MGPSRPGFRSAPLTPTLNPTGHLGLLFHKTGLAVPSLLGDQQARGPNLSAFPGSQQALDKGQDSYHAPCVGTARGPPSMRKATGIQETILSQDWQLCKGAGGPLTQFLGVCPQGSPASVLRVALGKSPSAAELHLLGPRPTLSRRHSGTFRALLGSSGPAASRPGFQFKLHSRVLEGRRVRTATTSCCWAFPGSAPNVYNTPAESRLVSPGYKRGKLRPNNASMKPSGGSRTGSPEALPVTSLPYGDGNLPYLALSHTIDEDTTWNGSVTFQGPAGSNPPSKARFFPLPHGYLSLRLPLHLAMTALQTTRCQS